VGRWPFRALRTDALPDLESLLVQNGITGAVVASLDAVLCPDPMVRNEPLLREIARRGPGFDWIATAVIDPTLGGWEKMAGACLALGARCLKLVPTYHLYPLTDAGLARTDGLGVPWVRQAARDGLAAVDRLCRLAAARQVPVALQVRLEDERAHHPLMRVPGLPAQEVAALAQRHPDGRFVVCGATNAELPPLRARNIWVEISFVESEDTLAGALAHVAPDRLLLGTHAPFFYPAVGVAKVVAADVSAGIRHGVGRGNAEALWPVVGSPGQDRPGGR
jgi:hypothetical protein